MRQETKIRAGIAALLYSMTNAVLFGGGLVFVLSVPELRGHGAAAIAAVVVLSMVLAAPAAWMIAPRLRARYWRQRAGHSHAGASPGA